MGGLWRITINRAHTLCDMAYDSLGFYTCYASHVNVDGIMVIYNYQINELNHGVC